MSKAKNDYREVQRTLAALLPVDSTMELPEMTGHEREMLAITCMSQLILMSIATCVDFDISLAQGGLDTLHRDQQRNLKTLCTKYKKRENGHGI